MKRGIKTQEKNINWVRNNATFISKIDCIIATFVDFLNMIRHELKLYKAPVRPFDPQIGKKSSTINNQNISIECQIKISRRFKSMKYINILFSAISYGTQTISSRPFRKETDDNRIYFLGFIYRVTVETWGILLINFVAFAIFLRYIVSIVIYSWNMRRKRKKNWIDETKIHRWLITRDIKIFG